MDNPSKNPSPAVPDTNLGISFNEIHSDEPHEEIDGRKSETSEPLSKKTGSHLTNRDDVFDVTKAFKSGGVEVGTIVSDKRKRKTSIGGHLHSALSEWWGGAKERLSGTLDTVAKLTEEEEVQTVPKAETRVDVLKEAMASTNIAPKNEHHIDIPKSRTFSQDVQKITGTPISIKEPDAIKKSGWTHTVEKENETRNTTSSTSHPVSTPDLRSSMVAPIVEKRVKNSINDFRTERPVEKKLPPVVPPTKLPAPEHIAYMQIPGTVQKRETPVTKSAVQIAPQVHEVATPQHKLAQETPAPKPMPEPILKAVQPVEPRKEAIISREQETKIPLRDVPTPVREEVFHETIMPPQKMKPNTSLEARKEELRATPKNSSIENPALRTATRYAILGGIVIVGITLAVVASIYFNVFSNSETPVRETTSASTFFTPDTQTEVPYTSSPKDFLSNLSTQINSAGSGVTQFYPTVADGAGTRTLTAQELFGSLSVNLDGKTIRALDSTVMIGSIVTTRNEPFMIIRSYNFDVLFAGLLAWERTMYSDLSPLFGSSYTGQQIFKDAIQDNKSIRILKDASGNEVMLYAFVNQNTVVITTSGEALSKIIAEF